MKIMCIGSELICIACIHTEYTLTAIRFECAFSQSTSIGGLVPVWRWIASSCEIMQILHSCVIDCMKKQAIREETSDKGRNNKRNFVASLIMGFTLNYTFLCVETTTLIVLIGHSMQKALSHMTSQIKQFT